MENVVGGSSTATTSATGTIFAPLGNIGNSSCHSRSDFGQPALKRIAITGGRTVKRRGSSACGQSAGHLIRKNFFVVHTVCIGHGISRCRCNLLPLGIDRQASIHLCLSRVGVSRTVSLGIPALEDISVAGWVGARHARLVFAHIREQLDLNKPGHGICLAAVLIERNSDSLCDLPHIIIGFVLRIRVRELFEIQAICLCVVVCQHKDFLAVPQRIDVVLANNRQTLIFSICFVDKRHLCSSGGRAENLQRDFFIRIVFIFRKCREVELVGGSLVVSANDGWNKHVPSAACDLGISVDFIYIVTLVECISVSAARHHSLVISGIIFMSIPKRRVVVHDQFRILRISGFGDIEKAIGDPCAMVHCQRALGIRLLVGGQFCARVDIDII